MTVLLAVGQEDANGSAASQAERLLVWGFVFVAGLGAGLDGVPDGVVDAGVVAGQEGQGHGELLGV